jgi:hypothetical protein
MAREPPESRRRGNEGSGIKAASVTRIELPFEATCKPVFHMLEKPL